MRKGRHRGFSNKFVDVGGLGVVWRPQDSVSKTNRTKGLPGRKQYKPPPQSTQREMCSREKDLTLDGP